MGLRGSDIIKLFGKLLKSGAVPNDQDFMKYVSATDKWEPVAGSGGGEVNPPLISQAEAEAGTDENERVVSALRMKQAIDALSIANNDFIDRIPLVMEIPQGTVAYPDIHTLATQGSKISGMVLPDGASAGIINLKCIVPNDLASTPNASIKFYILTLGTLVDKDVRLTVSSLAHADGENVDQAFTVETEQTVRMSNTIESLDIYDQALTDTLVAGDILTIHLQRDPADSLDNAGADIMVIYGFLEIDRRTV